MHYSDYNFHKTGIVTYNQVQGAIYSVENKAKNKVMMRALDGINSYLGVDKVRVDAQGIAKSGC